MFAKKSVPRRSSRQHETPTPRSLRARYGVIDFWGALFLMAEKFVGVELGVN